MGIEPTKGLLGPSAGFEVRRHHQTPPAPSHNLPNIDRVCNLNEDPESRHSLPEYASTDESEMPSLRCDTCSGRDRSAE